MPPSLDGFFSRNSGYSGVIDEWPTTQELMGRPKTYQSPVQGIMAEELGDRMFDQQASNEQIPPLIIGR